jgi:hypothetical protein
MGRKNCVVARYWEPSGCYNNLANVAHEIDTLRADGSVSCCQDEEASRRAALNHAVSLAVILRRSHRLSHSRSAPPRPPPREIEREGPPLCRPHLDRSAGAALSLPDPTPERWSRPARRSPSRSRRARAALHAAKSRAQLVAAPPVLPHPLLLLCARLRSPTPCLEEKEREREPYKSPV